MGRARFFHTLAFRLTLWYGGIFVVSSGLAFIVFYLLISQTIVQHMDQNLRETGARFTTAFSTQGEMGIKRLAAMEARAAGEKKVFYRLLYPDGEVFASSHMLYWDRIPIAKSRLVELLSTGEDQLETLRPRRSEGDVRVLYHFVGNGVILQTGMAMDAYSSFYSGFRQTFLVTMSLVVLLSVLSGWFMAKKALKGVDEVSRTADRISGGQLTARVPETGRQDELDRLAHTFNRMLDRIERLVTRIRRMGDNMAHDLKSPVTRIRGLAEVTLTQDGSLEEYRAMAASTVEESDRLLELINTILVMARTESGESGFDLEPVDLARLTAEACDLFQPLADQEGIMLTCSTGPAPVILELDRSMMQRCLSNLMDNALKYTPRGGTVDVSLEANGLDQVCLSVKDTGPGVPPEKKERVFERFYRADPSRSRPGSGLGLSLARAVARGHGGDVCLQSSSNTGSCFSITLPVGPAVGTAKDKPAV